MGVFARTADFSAKGNFPVYDAWDGLICARPAQIWLGLASKLSVVRLIFGKFELYFAEVSRVSADLVASQTTRATRIEAAAKVKHWPYLPIVVADCRR